MKPTCPFCGAQLKSYGRGATRAFHGQRWQCPVAVKVALRYFDGMARMEVERPDLCARDAAIIVKAALPAETHGGYQPVYQDDDPRIWPELAS